MFKRLLRNRKGTAEVIGSVLFIVILLFFFTNVYLWHDAATKEMNDFYAQKLNSPIAVVAWDSSRGALNVTNNGGVDAVISGVWINERSGSGKPDADHSFFDLSDLKLTVPAGGAPTPIPLNYDPSGKTGLFKVVTTLGNTASYPFP